MLSITSRPNLAGCLGGDRFERAQAGARQTRSLYVHILDEDTDRGSGGAAWCP